MWNFCTAHSPHGYSEYPMIWYVSIRRWKVKTQNQFPQGPIPSRVQCGSSLIWDQCCSAKQTSNAELVYFLEAFIIKKCFCSSPPEKVRVSYRDMEEGFKLEMRLSLELFVTKGLDSKSASHHLSEGLLYPRRDFPRCLALL